MKRQGFGFPIVLEMNNSKVATVSQAEKVDGLVKQKMFG